MVKVSVDVPLVRIGFGANSFAMLGGFKTVSEAVAIPVGLVFVPPSVDETNPLTLSYTPDAVVVTLTLIVQEAFTASEPPLNEIVCGAVVDRVPPHCDEDAVETVRPLGKLSVKPIPLKATAEFGFVRVNVSVGIAPTTTGFGENALLMVGEDGVPQPVNVILSRFISFPLDVAFAP